MDYLPIFIDVRNQSCLVFGGGEPARGKIDLLLKSNAKVHVVAKNLCNSLIVLKEKRFISHQVEQPSMADLKNYKLIFVATEDENLRESISKAVRDMNIPINVADCPELCTFTMPSIIDRSPLLIAVSTSGKSPTLARIIRSRLEATFPQSYSRLARMIGDLREKAKSMNIDRQERRRFWNRIFASPIIETFLSGKEIEANRAILSELEKVIVRTEGESSNFGQVCLVGAGPGDPDLLTLRALRLIQNADTIVYDRLVFPAILDYARRDAELIYVGKKSAKHTVPQDQINQKLVDLAKQGKMVVRLKGGDPFIFGRGGEEVEMLIESGISFQVVPGVTAASGCSTYAGIPLTHRDFAQSCIFVTGHLKDGSLDLNWENLVQPNQTIVFYMGLANAELLAEQLVQHGVQPSKPVAIVQKGTTRDQKVYTGVLGELGKLVSKNEVSPPAIIIVGEVVGLHEKMGGEQLNRILEQ